MKKIIVKEIDKLCSTTFTDKIITEYLIYYLENDYRLEAYTELGEEAKNSRLAKLLRTYGELNDDCIYYDITLEFIKFENYEITE